MTIDSELRGIERAHAAHPHDERLQYLYFAAMSRAGRTLRAGQLDLLPDQYEGLEEVARQYGRSIDEFARDGIVTEHGRVYGIHPSQDGLAVRNGQLRIPRLLRYLRSLSCISHQLSALDVTNTTRLERLNCMGNQLDALSLARNPNIHVISCSQNRLATLDLTRNPHLAALSAGLNALDELDLAYNPELEFLACSHNRLHALDLRKNPKIETIYCDDNRLTTFDLTQNPLLQELWCTLNPLSDLRLPHERVELRW